METPSKSQRKREALALQDMAIALSALPIKQLRLIAMPEKLFAALMEHKSLNGHRAKQRHAKYLGKIMRDIEMEELLRTFSKVPNFSCADFIKL